MTYNTIKKLTAMPYAQAHIEITEDGTATLFSYVTRVAEISSDGWLTVYDLYSTITRKHIGAFVKEYSKGVINYQNAKTCYNNNHKLNIFTGEVLEYDDV